MKYIIKKSISFLVDNLLEKQSQLHNISKKENIELML